MRRSVWIGALAFAAWALPAPAQTAPDLDACLAAHEQGQIARKHDKLLDARRAFATCAVDACPKLARDDCSTWLGEVEALVPTIELVVKGANGDAVPSARCTLDGVAIEAPLERRAIAVDAGVHALHCEADGVAPFDRAIAVASGEKGRRIEIALEATKPIPVPTPTATSIPTSIPTKPAPSPPPSPVPLFIAGGVAVAAFATFAYLGETGVSTEDNLRATCKPYCAESAVSAVRTRYNVADVFLGVGLVATGVTAWFYFSRSTPTSSDARVGVQALPGGGGARVAVPF
jgi:hypothetical protein